MTKILRAHPPKPRVSSLLLAAVLGLGFTQPTRADFEAGVVAYYQGDYMAAFLKFKRSGEQGNINAQYNIGFMYLRGQGVSQDDQEAAKWFRKAAEQGQLDAQTFLGALYADGQDVPQYYHAAAQWFCKAAGQGHAVAQYFLGQLHSEGLGVPQDYVQAYLWFSLSATQGYEEAALARDKIASLMTPVQLFAAQRLNERHPN
jgi:TPR repeat protein